MNLVLSTLEVEAPLVTLTKLNAPGLVMFGAWTLFSTLVLVAYTDLGIPTYTYYSIGGSIGLLIFWLID